MDAPAPSEASADKRKAIDLTRSDSEDDDDAAKRARRAGETAAHDVDDPTPWEAPEWKARCAAKRESGDLDIAAWMGPMLGRGYGLFGDDEDDTVDRKKTDEEMWREEHDPVGAKRMYLRRLLTAQASDGFDLDAHIEEQVAEFARKLEGPCECLLKGPGECESRTAVHGCVCSRHEDWRGKCKSTGPHDCSCSLHKSYHTNTCKSAGPHCCICVEHDGAGPCVSATHDCVCSTAPSYKRDNCKSATHDCICRTFKSWDTNTCKSATHHCVCANGAPCASATHDCVCRGFKSWDTNKCKYVGLHDCICVEHDGSGPCVSAAHNCICSTAPSWKRDACKSARHDCICRTFKSWETNTCKAAKHRL